MPRERSTAGTLPYSRSHLIFFELLQSSEVESHTLCPTLLQMQPLSPGTLLRVFPVKASLTGSSQLQGGLTAMYGFVSERVPCCCLSLLQSRPVRLFKGQTTALQASPDKCSVASVPGFASCLCHCQDVILDFQGNWRPFRG